jgi:hypothetical protein
VNIHQVIELRLFVVGLDIAGLQGGVNEVLRSTLDFPLDIGGDPSFGLSKRTSGIIDPDFAR